MGPLGRNGEAGRRERRPLELNRPGSAPAGAPTAAPWRPPARLVAALAGVIVGSAPLLVRLSSQGLVGRGLLLAAATTVVVSVAPDRARSTAAVTIATLLGVWALPLALGLVAGAFVAAGLLSTAAWAAPDAAPSWAGRGIAALGLSAGAAVLLGSHLASVPVLIVLVACGVAVWVEHHRPTGLERLAAAGRARATRAASALASTLERVAPRAMDLVTARPAVAWAALLAAFVAAAIVAIRHLPSVAIDDAAITFRYAVRIASGDGFTFNDGDRTNGASAPLYTLVLAVGHLLGIDVEQGARIIGVTCYAAVVALVAAIVGRARGRVAGLVAALVMPSAVGFRHEALNGMESGLAAVIGLSVVLLLLEGRTTWAGILLGVAVVNKLDAGFLAVAVGATWWMVHRRPPWRLALTAAATAAPWFVFSTLYFGSPLPYSASQKISGDVANATRAHDAWWILRRLLGDDMGPVLVAAAIAALALVVRLVRVDTRTSLAIGSCAAWALLHGTAFSLLDLGDPYPWYTTVLYPPVVVAGVLGLVVLADRVVALATRSRTAVRSTVATRWARAACATVLVVAALPGLRSTATTVSGGRTATDFELFEARRREAGRYVGRHADPGEVVRTCYGWIAFGAIDQPIDEICPLSTRQEVGRPTWIVVSYLPGDQRAELPLGSELQRTFRSPVGVTEVYRRPRHLDPIACRFLDAFGAFDDASSLDGAELRARFIEARDAADDLGAFPPPIDARARVLVEGIDWAISEGNRAGWDTDDPVVRALVPELASGEGGHARVAAAASELVGAMEATC